jgi:hypothetical protein
MKQKEKQQEEIVDRKDSEDFKRSGRSLEDFEDRCDNATVGMVMIGYDPESPF